MELSLVRIVLVGFLFVSCDALASKEVEALRRLKDAMYKDPLLVMSNWNVPDSDPCDWNGIKCSPSKDHIIKINISDTLMRGFIVPELGHISYLQELILRGNILMGTIPKEIRKLKKLKILDLGNNHLTGPIPAEIGSLSNIMIINLQSNGLTGKLPPEIGNLKYLRELLIERNRLQGSIPVATTLKRNGSNPNANISGLCKFPHLKVADFSYNFFNGKIPTCLDYLPRERFQGNCMKTKDVKQRPSSECAAFVAKKKKKQRHKWLLNFEIVTGSAVGLLFLVVTFAALRFCNIKRTLIVPWKKSASGKEEHFTVYVDSEMLKDVSRFTRQELEVACEDFSNIIDSCANSQVYKGTIEGGTEIAVISLCFKEEDWTGYLEIYFQREVANLARLDHENAGKLLGYCKENKPFTRMLVFEYASNGTLYEHLHYGEGSLVSWAKRMKVVIGVARGLKYLHTELDPPFTVSEVSSNAVYLTEDFTPKLVDFECWKTVLVRSQKDLSSDHGGICVLPNSMEHRDQKLKGNIYAFGLLLLEIVSGRPSYCQERGCLVKWAKDYVGGAPEVLVDPELEHFNQKELEAVCEVASQCLNLDKNHEDEKTCCCLVKELCETLESRISVSISGGLRSSSLAWAELALASPSNEDKDEYERSK
ncbi:Leucine-rich repeat transmembrane protein kinase family protein [Hirschfeldia incana]|nr:Leucine-rich repeat transmembrane protein kinase family protein [Hirschfeldia incana]